MLGWFRKKQGCVPNGGNPLAAVEDQLVRLIPGRVRSLGVREPVYCLRVWYYGTDTGGDRVPSLTLCLDAARRNVLADKGNNAPHYLWCADELGVGRLDAEIDDSGVAALCRGWYDHLPEDVPEAEQLRPMREMVQRVAARLNRLSWSSYAPVTDDFVVFAADASHTFCADYQELVASVPADRVELLRSRRMLGTREWYSLSTALGDGE
jgi:hypothetical protein